VLACGVDALVTTVKQEPLDFNDSKNPRPLGLGYQPIIEIMDITDLINKVQASGGDISKISEMSDASGVSDASSGIFGFEPVSLGIMFVMGVIGYGYWRYWKSTNEQKYLGVALVLMLFPYVSADPFYMVAASAVSMVVVHFVIE